MADPSQLPLYFAFTDGIFHHVCAECTALCCRGHGFAGSLKREMSFLFGEYPELGKFVTDRQGDLVTCATPTGQCFFLRSDNLCQIEIDHGRARKPGICLLFPFNDFYRIGETVVVAPHFMCPLRLNLPAAPGKVEGTHARIAESLKETGVLDYGFAKEHIDPANLPESEDPDSVIRRETAFRDLCGDGLGRVRFQDALDAASGNPGELREFRNRIVRLMQWPEFESNGNRDALDDLMLAVGPTLRMEALNQGTNGLLRFLAIGELVARGGLRMSLAPPTPQSVYGILEEMRPVIRLLAWGNEAPGLKKTQLKRPELGDRSLVRAASDILRDVGSQGVLPSLEKAFRPEFTSADRSALLYQLSEIIDPVIKQNRGRKFPRALGAQQTSVLS